MGGLSRGVLLYFKGSSILLPAAITLITCSAYKKENSNETCIEETKKKTWSKMRGFVHNGEPRPWTWWLPPFHHHGGDDGRPCGHHDANEVSGNNCGCRMAVHSAATTVAVEGGAAITITSISTAISAAATFLALGGSWRWDPRCGGHNCHCRAGGISAMLSAALTAAIDIAATLTPPS